VRIGSEVERYLETRLNTRGLAYCWEIGASEDPFSAQKWEKNAFPGPFGAAKWVVVP